MSSFNKNRYFRTDAEINATARKLVSYLRKLSRSRIAGTVTADDAHRFLTREGVQPEQVRTRLRFINMAFNNNSEYFYPVGEVQSTRPAARGRMITEWAPTS